MEVQPGVELIIHISAYVGGGGVAFIDPVVRPHPDNPEVTITVHGASDPTSPPLALPSLAEMAASGVDATPLQELDLLDDPEAPCTGGTTIAQAKLAMATRPDGASKLRFQGKLALGPLPLDPPLDPVARGARIRIEDATGHTVVDETIPGGAFDPTTSTGWRHDAGSDRWVYMRPGADGIRNLVLKRVGNAGNVVRFSAKAHLPASPVPSAEQLPLTATLVVDAPVADDGRCGEAPFGGDAPATDCPVHTGLRLACR
jgi:hypothetical protein